MASRGSRRARRRYAAEQREKVLRDAEMLGVCAAARRHGIPESTVSKWRTAEESSGGARSRASGLESGLTQTAGSVNGNGIGAAAEDTAAASIPSSEGRRYAPSERASILEDADKEGVAAAAKKHDVSRYSIYSWRRQVSRAAAGQGPSPTSGEPQAAIEEQRDRGG